MNDVTDVAHDMVQIPDAAETRAAINAAAEPIAAMQETFRKAAEKTVADSRAAFARAKAVADGASGAVETSVTTASKGVIDFNSKAIDALRAHAEANFDFLKAWINAKSLEEVFALQSELANKQAAALGAQAKELSALAQKIAADSAEPIKAHVAKAFQLSA
jgi:phasin